MNARIPLLTTPLTAQGLLDWYMQLLPLNLTWNTDDPQDLINVHKSSLVESYEKVALAIAHRRIHDTFADPCEIAMYAIGCHEAGLPAIAIAGMGAPRPTPACASPGYVPAPLTLFYLRMYHEGKRRTAHCVASGTGFNVARIAVNRLMGGDYGLEEQKTIGPTTQIICMQLN